MTEQHTPGPWRWELNLDSRELALCGGKQPFDLDILQPCRWGMNGATIRFREPSVDGNVMRAPHEVAGWHAPFQGREHHARWLQNVTHPDARLMAAAPELLEELEKAHAELEECGTRWHQQSALNRAAREALIARVRGDDTKGFHK